jgi:ABC-type protease/lipase transport system fused ATPase/permease subunit
MAVDQGAGQVEASKREFVHAAIALGGGWRRIGFASVCTTALSCLALAGPLYAFVLFDRVVPSGEALELVAATAVMLALYALGAGFDLARQRLLLQSARRLERGLTTIAARRLAPLPMRELKAIGSALRGPVPAALCDAPWVPLYLAALMLLHPLLGALAAAGAVVTAGCLLLVERDCAKTRSGERSSIARQSSRGMWLLAEAQRRNRLDEAARRAALTATLLRALRPALQSTMLGVGAYLVMIGACRPGSVLASAIVLARLLAPIETITAHWRSIGAARHGAERLAEMLKRRSTRSAGEDGLAIRETNGARVKIVIGPRRDYARSATAGGARSAASDLRPTAQ